jgi:hypothetical protein
VPVLCSSTCDASISNSSSSCVQNEHHYTQLCYEGYTMLPLSSVQRLQNTVVPAASAMEAPLNTVSMLSSLVALVRSVDGVRHLDLCVVVQQCV